MGAELHVLCGACLPRSAASVSVSSRCCTSCPYFLCRLSSPRTPEDRLPSPFHAHIPSSAVPKLYTATSRQAARLAFPQTSAKGVISPHLWLYPFVFSLFFPASSNPSSRRPAVSLGLGNGWLRRS